MTTLKSLVDETTNIKDELVECHTNLKNNLIEKGVECSDADKMPTLINKVNDVETTNYPLPKWYSENGFWIKGSDSPLSLSQQPCFANNKIYAFSDSNVCIYDTETNLWETKSTPYSRLDSSTNSIVGNSIYVMGGSTTPKSNKCYDITSNTWSTKSNLLTDRYSESMSCSVGTNVYIFGGYDSSNSIYNIIKKLECYDTISNTWSTKADYSKGVIKSQLVCDGSNLYCIGGYESTNNAVKTARSYDIISNTWSSKTNALSDMYEHASSSFKGFIYCIGGVQNSTNNSNITTIYDINLNKWGYGYNCFTSRNSKSCIGGNSIYVIGGKTKPLDILVLKNK